METPHEFMELGAHDHVPKEEDFLLGTVQPPDPNRPASYMPDAFFKLKALYQGHEPCCGGSSLAQLVQYFIFLSTGNQIALSQRFAYMAEKFIDKLPQDGTTIRAIGDAAHNLGVCLESLVNDDLTLPSTQFADFSQASPEAKADALTRKQPSYFFLNDLSFNGITDAAWQNKAVILQVKLGPEWWTNAAGVVSWNPTDILPLRPPVKVTSGHFIVAGAFEPDPSGKTRVWNINSFGSQWGQNGFGYFLDDYMPYIVAGLAFKQVPPSVHQALTAKQVSLAQMILNDIEQALGFIEQEITHTGTKVATSQTS